MAEEQTAFEKYAKLVSGFEFFMERFSAIGNQLCEIEEKVDKIKESQQTQELRLQKFEGRMDNVKVLSWVALVIAIIALVISIVAAIIAFAP